MRLAHCTRRKTTVNVSGDAVSACGVTRASLNIGCALVLLGVAFGVSPRARAGAVEIELTQLEDTGKHSVVTCPTSPCASAITLQFGELRHEVILRAVVRPSGVHVALFDHDQPLDFGGQPFVYIPTGHAGIGQRTTAIHPPVEPRSPPISMYHYPIEIVPLTTLSRLRIRVRVERERSE